MLVYENPVHHARQQGHLAQRRQGLDRPRKGHGRQDHVHHKGKHGESARLVHVVVEVVSDQGAKLLGVELRQVRRGRHHGSIILRRDLGWRPTHGSESTR